MRGYLLVFVFTFWGTTMLNVFAPSLTDIWRAPLQSASFANTSWGNWKSWQPSDQAQSQSGIISNNPGGGEKLKREQFWKNMIKEYFDWHNDQTTNNASVQYHYTYTTHTHIHQHVRSLKYTKRQTHTTTLTFHMISYHTCTRSTKTPVLIFVYFFRMRDTSFVQSMPAGVRLFCFSAALPLI